MSHKTEIKTQLNNGHYLKQALTKLGFTYKEGKNLKTRGNYGVHEDVDILIEGNGTKNFNDAIGFKQQADGTYTAVGDFYALRTQDGRSVSANMLKCECTAHSKEAELNDRLQSMGFVNDPAARKENNEYIEVTFSRNPMGI